MGKNAYFCLNVKNDGVFVEVFPPKEDGMVVSIGELTSYLNARNLSLYDVKQLNDALNEREKISSVKVGLPSSINKVDEAMAVSIYPDKMQAVVRFYPPANEGNKLTAQDIIAGLTKEGIKKGILQEEILKFLQNPEYCTDYILAKGKTPVEGHNAEIKYYFNTDINLKPKRNEDGTVDYKELNTISRVNAGDKIAELIPEDPGEDGYNILGEAIKPHSVKTKRLEGGKNMTLSEDKKILYSAVTGHASLVSGKIFVSDVYEIPADVDNSTGNIDYNGSVTIKGNVKGGFKVVAIGDIVVEGVVEDATLISDGQIIVRHGIHGMNKGMLKAKSNIICRFIENATVVSGGYVDAEAILHSKVDAYGEVIVKGKKGFITGGVVRAGNLIEAQTIGSEMETLTQIEVGVDPIQKEKYIEVQKKIKEYDEQIGKLKPIVTTYSNKMKQGEALSKEQMTYIRKLALQLQSLQGEVVPLKQQVKELERLISNENAARVKVLKDIYPGVNISISDAKMTLKDQRTYSQFIRQEGEIKIVPL